MTSQPRRCALLLAVCAACSVGPSADTEKGGPITDFPGDGSEPPRAGGDGDLGDGDGNSGALQDSGTSTGNEDWSGGDAGEMASDGGTDGGTDDAGDASSQGAE